jgi:aminomethyltransferase
MMEFAGWKMPLVYSDQSHVQSHLHTRASASLFDISHLLQMRVKGRDQALFLESLVVADLVNLREHGIVLTLFTNNQGGIKDDIMITKITDHFHIIANASCAQKDIAHLQKQLDMFHSIYPFADIQLDVLSDQSLLAFQGPKSAEMLSQLTIIDPSTHHRKTLLPPLFMTSLDTILDAKPFDEIPIRISRCGYTGEDGFEISVSSKKVTILAEYLMRCFGGPLRLAGLAVRDSLRLEAGLCLYGQELDENITPIEAGLAWCIGKRRRWPSDVIFPGWEIILRQLQDPNCIRKRRCGFEILEGAPARAHASIMNLNKEPIGKITSGAPSPSLNKSIAMGFIDSPHPHHIGTETLIMVRDAFSKARIVKMPFITTHYGSNKPKKKEMED